MQKNKIFLRQLLCVLLSVVFVATMLSGCNNNENGNSPSGDETTSISKGESGDIDVATAIDKIASSFDERCNDSGSPIAQLFNIFSCSGEEGYIMSKENIYKAYDDYSSVSYKNSISSDPNVGTLTEVVVDFADTDSISFSYFHNKDYFSVGNSEIFGDKMYGISYDKLYNGINDTVYAPEGNKKLSLSEEGYNGFVQSIATHAGSDISARVKIYDKVESVFVDNAEVTAESGEYNICDQKIDAEKYSITLSSSSYSAFYSDLVEYFKTDISFKNFYLNENLDIMTVSSFDEVFEDFISELETTANDVKASGNTMNVTAYVSDGKMVRFEISSDKASKAYSYIFEWLEDGTVKFNTSSKAPLGESGQMVEETSEGTITTQKKDNDYSSVCEINKITLANNGENKINYSISFDWNSKSGNYTYAEKCKYGTQEMGGEFTGTLLVSDDSIKFSSDGLTKKYGTYIYIYPISGLFNYLEEHGKMNVEFALSGSSVNEKDYVDVLSMTQEDADVFVSNTYDRILPLFNNKAWVDICVRVSGYALGKPDFTKEVDLLNFCSYYMLNEVNSCFVDCYRDDYKNAGAHLLRIANNSKIIENGKFYFNEYDITTVCEEGDEKIDHDWEVIVFKDYVATIKGN